MTPWSIVRRRVPTAALAVLVLALALFGCNRPPDEAWLRFLGFRESGGTTPLTVLSGNLLDGATDSADAAFSNGSEPVGVGSGTGIFVYRALVEYQLPGFSPPAADYPLNLYIPAGTPASGTTPASGGTATLGAFPLATVSLKNWLIQTHAFDDPKLVPAINLTARVTFFAVTDEGLELRTAGGIAITLLTAETGGF